MAKIEIFLGYWYLEPIGFLLTVDVKDSYFTWSNLNTRLLRFIISPIGLVCLFFRRAMAGYWALNKNSMCLEFCAVY